MKPKTIEAYNKAQADADREICETLKREIDRSLPKAESKIWHAHPVWFLADNPIVGYSKLKDCVRLMFWSGADFGEAELKAGSGKFKDASARFTNADQIKIRDLKRWLGKAKIIQWDYKNLQKRQGRLLRIC
jgi:hypothetical protein